MKKCSKYFTLFFIMIVSTTAFAQNRTSAGGFHSPGITLGMPEKPSGLLDSLFDPSRFQMSQSYTMSVMSFGGRTFNQGHYLNTLSFQVSDPLTVQVGVGFMHQPFGGPNLGFGLTGNEQRDGQFYLQQARIRYEISKSAVITVEYQSTPGFNSSPFSRIR